MQESMSLFLHVRTRIVVVVVARTVDCLDAFRPFIALQGSFILCFTLLATMYYTMPTVQVLTKMEPTGGAFASKRSPEVRKKKHTFLAIVRNREREREFYDSEFNPSEKNHTVSRR